MRSMGEFREIKREKEDRTEKGIREYDDLGKDTDDATGKLDRIEPVLKDTAERLNRVADDLKQTVRALQAEVREKVNEGVRGEKAEVSDPAREGEKTQRSTIEGIEGMGPSKNEQIESENRDALEAVRDEADFLGETAEDSERHQEGQESEAERAEAALLAALENMRRY